MPEPESFQCVRCQGEDVDPLTGAPFRDELGRRILQEICRECWDEWKQRQMLLINHYGLNLRDEEAREFLRRNLRHFLFDEGDAAAEIDTSMEGEISW